MGVRLNESTVTGLLSYWTLHDFSPAKVQTLADDVILSCMISLGSRKYFHWSSQIPIFQHICRWFSINIEVIRKMEEKQCNFFALVREKWENICETRETNKVWNMLGYRRRWRSLPKMEEGKVHKKQKKTPPPLYKLLREGNGEHDGGVNMASSASRNFASVLPPFKTISYRRL